jgi:hypothetical protein
VTSITDQLFTNRRFGLDETCDVRHDAVDFLFHRDTRGGARMTSGDTKASGLRPTRRTVVKGAAWAVPVITVASAAPAAAASPPVDPEFIGTFCKHPGNPKWYHVNMKWTNLDPNYSVTVTLNTLTVGAETRQAYFEGDTLPPPNQDQTTGVKDLTIPVGEARCVYVDAGLFPNSANGGAVLTFSVRINSDPPVDIPGSVPGGTLVDSSLLPCGTGADTSPSPNPDTDPPHATPGPAGPCEP